MKVYFKSNANGFLKGRIYETQMVPKDSGPFTGAVDESGDLVSIGVCGIAPAWGEYTGPVPANEGWILHFGGGCPVDPERKVKVFFRNGDNYGIVSKAGDLRWLVQGYESDIVAYCMMDEVRKMPRQEEPAKLKSEIAKGLAEDEQETITSHELGQTKPIEVPVGTMACVDGYAVHGGQRPSEPFKVQKGDYIEGIQELSEEQYQFAVDCFVRAGAANQGLHFKSFQEEILYWYAGGDGVLSGVFAESTVERLITYKQLTGEDAVASTKDFGEAVREIGIAASTRMESSIHDVLSDAAVHAVNNYIGVDQSALQTQQGGTHYKDMAVQPIEYIVANKIPYREANVIKYISRHANKNGAEDIRKAIHYLEMILETDYACGGHHPKETPKDK